MTVSPEERATEDRATALPAPALQIERDARSRRATQESMDILTSRDQSCKLDLS
jgi:hypothetical protein